MSARLSDATEDLIKSLSSVRHQSGSLLLQSTFADRVFQLLEVMKTKARELENDVSRLKWNAGEFARQAEFDEQAIEDAIFAEIDRADTNLVLFIPRDGFPWPADNPNSRGQK